MSHNYLFDTHEAMKEWFRLATEAHEKAEVDSDDKYFAEGRLTALKEFKQYIAVNVEPKLPKRLYQKLKKSEG